MLEDFPELQSARKAWANGNLPEAAQAFQAAIQARPTNIRARLEFSKALGQLHEIRQAEELLWPALELARGNARNEVAVARAFRSIFRQSHALEILLDLRDRNELLSQELGELAVLLQQFGRLEEAHDAIEQCIAQAPTQPQPKLIQAQILRHRGELEESQSILESLLKISGMSPRLPIACWSELAQIHDRNGNYDEAVHCAMQAKDLLRDLPDTKRLREQSNALNRSFAELYATLNPQMIQRWLDRTSRAGEQSTTCEVAHLLSFPRTGTTLLEQVLDAHPKIVAAPERVVFSKLIFPDIIQLEGRPSIRAIALDAASDETLATQSRRYMRLHSEVANVSFQHQLLIDKNPNHTSLWAGLIRLLPRSRFIITSRDARDVVVSCFLRYFPLSEFSVAFLDWQSTCEMYRNEQRIQNRLRELLPDRYIEVRYEDMILDLQREADRVLKFLGLPETPETTHYLDATKHKLVNSPSQLDVRKPVYNTRVGRWKNYADHLAPYLSILDSTD